MRLLAMVGLLSALAAAAQEPAIVVPAGTQVALALPGAVLAKSVQLGESIDAVTVFPVTVDNQVAIPPGTSVKGRIDIMVLPGAASHRAEFRIQFTEMVFADKSVVELPDGTFASVYVLVSPWSNVLLDVGTQMAFSLASPLKLDAQKIAAAARLSTPPDVAHWKSVVRCSSYPVAPMVMPPPPQRPPPQILFPPMPPTNLVTPLLAGAPSPSGARDVPCPGAPMVVTEPFKHEESFKVKGPVRLAGQQLTAGAHQFTWQGLGPDVGVALFQDGAPFAIVRARVVALGEKARKTEYVPRTNADGSVSMESMRFGGRTFGLRFGQ